jgi:hypothetical protein
VRETQVDFAFRSIGHEVLEELGHPSRGVSHEFPHLLAVAEEGKHTVDELLFACTRREPEPLAGVPELIIGEP